MKITFCGAAKTVTGSCYFVETDKYRFLVDCGMFQGHMAEEQMNRESFPFNPSSLDFMLLTHAHIDHSGRIPKLYKDGFRGRIYCTKATGDLLGIMLPDSGHIQETENEWLSRKQQRSGVTPEPPLYTYEDAVESLVLIERVPYYVSFSPNRDIRCVFHDAGHILGSSILEITIKEYGRELKVVFSGDLGNKNIPILRDPERIKAADYLIMETTYGNRLHKNNDNKIELFMQIILDTVAKGGNVIIPSFAVGRTQEIIYELNKNRDKYGEKMRKLLEIPVIIDSPLAISATEVFRNNLECFDEEAREYVRNGENPLDFPGLKFTRTADESRTLNESTESKIIISASGMCEAGRIKHHLKHNLWRRECTVLFVGYQAPGTLGRRILDGVKKVKIFGEEIRVNARIETIDGFSGHADQRGLLDWLSGFEKRPGKVFLIHGEEEVIKEFSPFVRERFNIETMIPGKDECYELSTDGKVTRVSERAEIENYERLRMYDLVENIKERLDNAAAVIIGELKSGIDDNRISELKRKLLELEYQLQKLNQAR